MNPKTNRSCTYCGSTTNLTLDHIPPKSLFAKPRPGNLITVPACARCNLAASKDDEYFRYALSMNERTGSQPDAAKGRQASLRSLLRPKAVGLKKKLIAAVGPTEIRTPQGLILGTRLGYEVELERIFRIVDRMVRGLFYHEAGLRLRGDYDIIVHSDETVRDLPRDVQQDLRRDIILPLSHASPRVFGRNTFSYRFQFSNDNQHLSAWALTFFGSIPFIAVTGPQVTSESAATNPR